MSSKVITLILVATFLGQLGFVLCLHSNSEKYRQPEHDKAYKAYILSNTPENNEALNSEEKLLQQRQILIELIWLGGLLINSLVCYKFCNFGIMKPALRILVSICWGWLIVFGLSSNCPENFEPALAWSLPLFHKLFPPLESGPNPVAYLYALATDVIILATITFILLSIKRKENKQLAA